MSIAEHHNQGTSFDDAIALITTCLGEQADTAALREQVKPILVDGARVVAAVEMLAVLAAGWIEALQTATGRPAEEWLQGVALRDRRARGR